MPDTLEHTTAPLRFNGHSVAWTVGLRLSDLMAAKNMNADSVATAVNGDFVQREQRAATVLHPGDEVLTFQAIVGG
jgi:sulfur carrier protein